MWICRRAYNGKDTWGFRLDIEFTKKTVAVVKANVAMQQSLDPATQPGCARTRVSLQCS